MKTLLAVIALMLVAVSVKADTGTMTAPSPCGGGTMTYSGVQNGVQGMFGKVAAA